MPEPESDSTHMEVRVAMGSPEQPPKEVKYASKVRSDENPRQEVRRPQSAVPRVEKPGGAPKDYFGAFWAKARAKGPFPDCGLLHVCKS